MLSIIEWNINPNQDWYVVLKDSGSDILVQLYNFKSDAESEINVVAEGNGAYGSGSEVQLNMNVLGSPIISVFNSDLVHHITVIGDSGDSNKIYHIAKFVDLEDISNGIYKSTDLIKSRILYEINEHTHVKKERSISLAGVYPDISVGGVVNIQSDIRGLDVLSIVTGNKITGTINSLTTQIETVEYVDMVHNG